jgi:hypothetical protein
VYSCLVDGPSATVVHVVPSVENWMT